MMIDCVVANADRLGESPIWSCAEQALYWIDSRAPRIYRLDPSTLDVQSCEAASVIGCIAFRASGGLIAATAEGIFAVDFATGATELLAAPANEPATNRFNDGRCDRRGRLWAGTMSDVSRDPLGALYKLEPDRRLHKMRSDIVVPNSIAFSPDDRTMYFADTYRTQILAYSFSLDDGVISAPRLFVDLTDRKGRPDGSAVDADGCLWNAEYAGGRVVRYTPRGEIDRVIELPISQPTCCCFGGSRLDTLYFTSATQRMTPEALAKEPLAGGLFAISVGVAGLPESAFAG